MRRGKIGLIFLFTFCALYYYLFVRRNLSVSFNTGHEINLKENEFKKKLEEIKLELNEKEKIIANLNEEIKNLDNELKTNLETTKKQLDENEKIISELNKENQMFKTKNQEQLKNNKYDLSHLKQKTQFVFGPIQDDEALLLYGLVKVIRPKLVVEFGLSYGDSATNWLKALDEDAKFYSYDVIEWNPKAEVYKDPRFKFYLKSQTDFNSTDVDNKEIDIVYFDAGHKFDVNTKAFQIIINHVTPNAIIVVHDTGLHINYTENCACDFDNKCGDAHQKDERLFINWIIDNYPEWEIVELHSFNIFRHGLTLLQRRFKLSTKIVDTKFCEVAS